jgi:hypothetical protein
MYLFICFCCSYSIKKEKVIENMTLTQKNGVPLSGGKSTLLIKPDNCCCIVFRGKQTDFTHLVKTPTDQEKLED